MAPFSHEGIAGGQPVAIDEGKREAQAASEAGRSWLMRRMMKKEYK